MQNYCSKLTPLVAYHHADGRQDTYGGKLGCALHMQYSDVPLRHLVPAYQQT